MAETPSGPMLIVEGGALDGATMELSEGSSTIVGSGRLAHLRIDHPEIELAHVKITWDIYGISMVDNGSRHGTWCNGEPVETVALLDGDVIMFVAPGTTVGVPCVRIRIPEGSVAPPPPPDPEAPAPPPPSPSRAPARTAKKKAPARRRGKRPSLDLPLKGIGIALAGLGLVGAAAWFVIGYLGAKPELTSLAPGQSIAGQAVTLNGSRFHAEPARNLVWFGERSVPASTVSDGTLRVTVPSLPAAGPVRVTVETPNGRSNALSFVLLPPLAVTGLDPPGALPGDEIVLRGEGLGDEALTITVGGQPATVVASADDSVRFEMPAIDGDRGSKHSVVATVGQRSTAPLDLALGRLPLVVSFDPAQAVAGEVVRIRGVGFSTQLSANAVSFDGVPSLVARAAAEELTVFAPIPVQAQSRTLAQVVVTAGGRTSDAATYPLRRLLSGSYVLRFLAAAVGEGGAPGQAVVATEMAPVLVLTDKHDDGSVAVRALRVSKLLNDVVDRARKGEDVTFTPVERPSIGVGTSGAGELIVEVKADDAAAYAAAPGVSPRGAPPAPLALAGYWAALLNDYLVVCTGRGSPSRVAALSPRSGRAFAQLRSALPWQYERGISNEGVARLSGRLRQQLREAALQVP